MKLLFDENISPQLIDLLSDLYPDSTHVHQCGLGSSDDPAYAKGQRPHHSEKPNRTLRSSKFIWLRANNCTTAEIGSLLRKTFPARFIQQDNETCLILEHRPSRKWTGN